MDDEDDYQSGCRMCKKLSALLPSIVAWGLLLGCTLAFYLIMAPALALPDRWGKIALVVVGVDGVLFLLVLSNLVMAMCIDPGIHPMATFSEEQAGSEDFRSPLYKNVVINGISVRMKWCVTCKFYRPPRASHCSVCNRCIDNFDHHCPWVHNCVGWRNYRYFFFFLLALSAHMIYVCVVCLIFVFNRQSTPDRCVLMKVYPSEIQCAVDPPFLCGCVLILMTVLLSIPVVGLTIFHLVLVLRGRSTNEQVTDQFPERRVYDEVTGKFQSGFNPFTRGWIYNCFFTLCHSQQPAFEGYNPRKSQGGDKAKRKKKLRTKVLVSDETSVLYVPDADGKDGHIRLKQLRGSDSDSVGTALSLARQPSLGNATALPPTANGSTCNLYEDRGSMRVVSPDTTAYEASLAEAMAGSALSPSVSSERVTLLNGDRRGKPLAFTDALRIHDQLNSPVKAVNL